MIGFDVQKADGNNHVAVKIQVKNVLLWPSDTFSIDYVSASASQNDHRPPPPPPVHTVIVFIPGNPGLIDWYIPFFTQMLTRLGPGFVCRGVALAGHSLDAKLVDVEYYKHDNSNTNRDLRDTAIPWTVDGQVLHKCAYMDMLLDEFDKGDRPEMKHDNDTGKKKSDVDNNQNCILVQPVRFVFISHSIGVHFTQRMCILRPDILQRTRLLIHLMPFIRMDAPIRMQTWLNTCARAPETAIAIVQAALAPCNNNLLPRSMLDKILSFAMDDAAGRGIAVKLLQIPAFVRNFGMLGFEEIRDVPQVFDVSAMRYIGQQFGGGCPIDLLYAGNDHWAPAFHMQQLTEFQAQTIVPGRDKICITYKPNLQHDFVSRSEQVPIVMEFCVNRIQKVVVAVTTRNAQHAGRDSFVASSSSSTTTTKQPLHSRL